ncbi:LysR family transcriptional regulator [Muricoccus radiodurans]|uniref:LysR family transcriptional regulator n=1 Tax=Muricoccus radiodurans TaxID=2231721 RepID=UPI003CEC44BF
MLDMPGLKSLLAVAEFGTVHAAARHLQLSQAALSRRIQRLEADLGIRLFLRSGRRLHLSEAGQRLLPGLREHVDAIEGAIRRVQQETHYGRPTVSLGCLPTLATVVLPAALREFERRRPGVFVRIIDDSAADLLRLVANGTVDFAVTQVGIAEPGLTHDLLGEDRLVLVLPAGHALAGAGTVGWRDLKGLALIAPGPLAGYRRVLDDARAEIGEDLSWRYEVQRITTAIGLVAAGVGATILPRLSLPAEYAGRLSAVALEAPHLVRRIGIVRRAGEPVSPPAEALRRALAARLRAALSAAPALSPDPAEAPATPDRRPGAAASRRGSR